jgi:hypothetical protein
MKTHVIQNQDLSVFEFDISDLLDFPKLVEAIDEYKNNYPQFWNTNKATWQSDRALHRKTTAFDKLISIIEEKTSLIVNDSKHRLQVIPKVEDSWVIVYTKMSYVTPHRHHKWGYSAVCYIEAECPSPIEFNTTELIPETGKLFIFSGLLTHSVRPMLQNNKKRISFICNLYPYTTK